MKLRKIWAIKGGADPGYEPMPAFNGARAGWIWDCGPGGAIIELDTAPVELVVENYPDTRHENEANRIVRVRMFRRGPLARGDSLLVQVEVALHDLAERPSLVAGGWQEEL